MSSKFNTSVFPHRPKGVTVVANNLWAAMQGRKRNVKVEWDDSGGFSMMVPGGLYAEMRGRR